MSLLIFDCDGVLVDSELIAFDVLAQMLTELGRPMSFAESRRRFMGRRTGDVLAEIEKELGHPIALDTGARMKAALFARLRDELKPVAGVAAAIARLDHDDFGSDRSKLMNVIDSNKLERDLREKPVSTFSHPALARPICVASSSPPDRIALSLAVTGLAPLFGTHVFSAEQVAHGKPAPDLFLLAAKSMGVPPQDAIVIEDSPTGVTAARRAGMGIIGFAGASHADGALIAALREAGAENVVTDMADLPAAIGRVQAARAAA